jgi:hypothetical protein
MIADHFTLEEFPKPVVLAVQAATLGTINMIATKITTESMAFGSKVLDMNQFCIEEAEKMRNGYIEANIRKQKLREAERARKELEAKLETIDSQIEGYKFDTRRVGKKSPAPHVGSP